MLPPPCSGPRPRRWCGRAVVAAALALVASGPHCRRSLAWLLTGPAGFRLPGPGRGFNRAGPRVGRGAAEEEGPRDAVRASEYISRIEVLLRDKPEEARLVHRLLESGAVAKMVQQEAEAAAAQSKKAWSKFKPGQTVEGTVVRFAQGQFGYQLDIGAKKYAFLEACELEDGFPTKPLQMKETILARVLGYDEERKTLYLTRRSGDLARPPRWSRSENADFSWLKSVAPEETLEGEVHDMTLFGACVRIDPPDGGEGFSGLLHRNNMSQALADQITRGTKLRVRVKAVDMDRKRLEVTVADP